MKKFIRKLLLFTPYTILLYIIFTISLGLILPDKFLPNLNHRIGGSGFMYTRLREIPDYKDVDILFLGSSHAYRSFDTRFYQNIGLKVFNLGSSAQTPTQTLYLLNKYIDTLKPKLIVYEVFPLTFENDGLESALDLVANDRIDFDLLEMCLSLNHIKLYNNLIMGFFRQSFQLNKNYKEERIKSQFRYIPGGYVQEELSFYKHTKNNSINYWQFKDFQIEAFKKIISLIKERPVDLLLVQTPITKNMFNSYNNNIEIDNFFKDHEKDYINFNYLLELDDSLHFSDSHHLNQDGVALFNQAFIDHLLKKQLY